jgi:hypothetical protein
MFYFERFDRTVQNIKGAIAADDRSRTLNVIVNDIVYHFTANERIRYESLLPHG